MRPYLSFIALGSIELDRYLWAVWVRVSGCISRQEKSNDLTGHCVCERVCWIVCFFFFFLFLVFIFCMTVKILLALWFTISSGRRRSFRAKYKLILHFIRRARNHKKYKAAQNKWKRHIPSWDGLVFLRSFFRKWKWREKKMPVAQTQPNITNWCKTPSTNIGCVILLTIFTIRLCMHFRRKKRVSHHVFSLVVSTFVLMESYFRNRARMIFFFFFVRFFLYSHYEFEK